MKLNSANTEHKIHARTTNKITYTHTLLCSSSVLRLSRLLKISSLCSSLLVLLMNLQTVSRSVSKFCQELRVAYR